MLRAIDRKAPAKAERAGAERKVAAAAAGGESVLPSGTGKGQDTQEHAARQR